MSTQLPIMASTSTASQIMMGIGMISCVIRQADWINNTFWPNSLTYLSCLSLLVRCLLPPAVHHIHHKYVMGR